MLSPQEVKFRQHIKLSNLRLFNRVIKALTTQKQENIHVALFLDSAVDKICFSYKHISM